MFISDCSFISLLTEPSFEVVRYCFACDVSYILDVDIREFIISLVFDGEA